MAEVESLDLYKILDGLNPEELKRFRSHLSDKKQNKFQPIPKGKLENDVTDVVDKMKQFYPNSYIDITLYILEKMGQHDLIADIKTQTGMQTVDQQRAFVDAAPTRTNPEAALQDIKKIYREQMIEEASYFHDWFEDGQMCLLQDIYTKLYITDGKHLSKAENPKTNVQSSFKIQNTKDKKNN